MNTASHIFEARQWPDTLWNSFEVRYAFPVIFAEGLFDPENPTFAEALAEKCPNVPVRLLVVADSGLLAGHPDLPDRIAAYVAGRPAWLDLAGPVEVVPGGEVAKNDPTILKRIHDRIHAARIDRHSYVVGVGGGALLDAVGLAAATAHRGVRMVRVPTTVLGQNDSGVGVKNAVNLKGVKNYMGTFAPPWAVLNDYGFIRTLPEGERIAGVSEAVKVALIRDRAFFEWIETNAGPLRRFDPAAERYMIRRCAELHVHQISRGGDPFEMGSARPLDYGHWSAHKLEALTGHRLKHGEAVAIGMALDARYSVLAGRLAPGKEERVARLLERLGLPIFHEALDLRDATGTPAILRGLEEFREHLGGALTITLLGELGTGIEVNAIDEERMGRAIDWLRARKRT